MSKTEEYDGLLEATRPELAAKEIELKKIDEKLRAGQDNYLYSAIDTAIAFSFLYKTQSIMRPIWTALILLVAANAATAVFYFLFRQGYYESLILGLVSGAAAVAITVFVRHRRGGIRVTLEDGKTTSVDRSILNYFKEYRSHISDEEYLAATRNL